MKKFWQNLLFYIHIDLEPYFSVFTPLAIGWTLGLLVTLAVVRIFHQ